MSQLTAFVPMDRCQAIVQQQPLPDRSVGVAMLADISGFTLLTRTLVEELGDRRGAEELIGLINPIYEALIEQLHHYQGSVIGFAGDSITCWFDAAQENEIYRALACSMTMQMVLRQFNTLQTPAGTTVSLSVKISLAAGPARRFLVGDWRIRLLEVLGGETLVRMARGEQLAQSGDIVIDENVAAALNTSNVKLSRIEVDGRFYRLIKWNRMVPYTGWVEHEFEKLTDVMLMPWVSPMIYERVLADRQPVGDLRTVAACFIKFGGIEFDRDDEAGRKLDQFIKRVQQVVNTYDGLLMDLVVGDKGSYLYVNFGALQAYENNAERAVAAALVIAELRQEFDYISTLQIGLTSGPVWTGVTGATVRHTFAVMGNPVNTAARLMEIAANGQIFCDRQIYEGAQSSFTFKHLPPVRIKRRINFMRVYQPIGRKNLQIAAGGPRGMVGRDEQRGQISVFLQALRANRPQLLLIEGEAGIGKSTMVEYLVELMRQQSWAPLIGSAQNIARNAPYRAWRELFYAFFDLDYLTDPIARRLQIETLFVELLPEEADWLPVFDDIVNVGIKDTDATRDLPASNRRQKLNSLVLALLRCWMRENPLLLIIEDAHWLDPLSWDLCQTLIQNLISEQQPFGMCIVSRPIAEHESGYRQWSGWRSAQHDVTTMYLEAFPIEGVIQLVANRLDIKVSSVPPELVDFVVKFSAGNPFFVSEMVWTLLDRELVSVESGSCSMATPLDQVGELMPDSLSGLVLARIDRLSREQQFMLKVAAVIGRVFAVPLLYDLLNEHMEVDQATLDEQLDQLERSDFAYLESVEPTTTYRFKHIITQEATYQTLLFQQRRELHRQVGEWYENRLNDADGDVYLPLLVHHFQQAEKPEKVGVYAYRAGQRAAAQYANEDAISYFTIAIDLLDRDHLNTEYGFRLLGSRVPLYGLLGEREKQDKDLDLLLHIANQLNRTDLLAETYSQTAQYFEAISNYEKALEAAEEAIACARKIEDRGLEAEGLLYLGHLQWRMSQFLESRATLQKAADYAGLAKRKRVQADAIRQLGVTYMYRREIVPAEKYFQQSYDLYAAISDKVGQARALNNLGFAARNKGTYDQSITYLVDGLQLFRQIGDLRGSGLILHNLAECYSQLGIYQKAFSYIWESYKIRKKINEPRGQLISLVLLSWIEICLGMDEQSLEHVLLSQDIAHQSGNGHLIVQSEFNVCSILLYLKRIDDAFELLEPVIERSRALNMTSYANEAEIMLAEIQWQRGNIDQAYELIKPILPSLEDDRVSAFFRPGYAYFTCIQILHQVDQSYAEKIAQLAYQSIMRRADLLQDDEMRHSYLTNVTAVADILELASSRYSINN